MSKKLKADIMLLLAALIWGASFVAQKAGMDYIGPFTFNGIRFLLGSLVLIPVILVLDRSKAGKSGGRTAAKTEIKAAAETKPEPAAAPKQDGKTLLIAGVSCGVILFVAALLQQFGMLYTSAGKTGFITALYIVLVPILGLFAGRKVRPVIWFCVTLAAYGLYLLCVKDGFSIGRGDLLVIACAFGFALHILAIDHFSPKVDGVKLSFLQFLTAGILSVPFTVTFETVDWANVLACWQPLLYSAVLSCGVAYTLQIVAQRDTEPTVASLILSTEAIFAVVAGMILLNEQISNRELLGCIMMFAAILITQFPLYFERLSQKRGLIPDKISDGLSNLLVRPTHSGREAYAEKPSQD